MNVNSLSKPHFIGVIAVILTPHQQKSNKCTIFINYMEKYVFLQAFWIIEGDSTFSPLCSPLFSTLFWFVFVFCLDSKWQMAFHKPWSGDPFLPHSTCMTYDVIWSIHSCWNIVFISIFRNFEYLILYSLVPLNAYLYAWINFSTVDMIESTKHLNIHLSIYDILYYCQLISQIVQWSIYRKRITLWLANSSKISPSHFIS